MRALVLASASLALLIAGCGGGGGSDVAVPRSALVDPDRPPLINSLEQVPGSDDLLLTTNRGFYRIADGKATTLGSKVSTPDGTSPVGMFLEVAQGEGGALLGSGHPDEKKRVAGFLGLLRSETDGRTWTDVSRYGLADLHTIRTVDGSIYAYDVVLPAVIVSPDGGRTWEERSAPPGGRVIDFVVDPSEPDQMVASTKSVLFRSTDGGRSWTSAAKANAARLEWPEPGTVYRADEDGQVYESTNHAATWDLVGRIDGSPRALKAVGRDELYAALEDATIVHSTDGGRNWEEYFTP
jgi:photosystem II stability/assembly factor-like uncharacterized protein